MSDQTSNARPGEINDQGTAQNSANKDGTNRLNNAVGLALPAVSPAEG